MAENVKVAPVTLDAVAKLLSQILTTQLSMDLKLDGIAFRQNLIHKQEMMNMAKTTEEILAAAKAQAEALAARVESLETVEDSVKALVEGLVASNAGIKAALEEALKNQGLSEPVRANLEEQLAKVDAQITAIDVVKDKFGALVTANTSGVDVPPVENPGGKQ